MNVLRYRALAAIALTVLAAACARAAPAYHGMSYTSFGSDSLSTAGSDQSLANMSIVGVDSVAINFWWFQDSVSSNSMGEDFSRYSSTISSVEHAIDTAHGLGMKVLLKPMLDVKDGTWRAYVNPSNKDQWFTNYTSFLGAFADVAQAKGVELYSIGCEMNTVEDPANNGRWTNLIDNLRSRYDGPLTYSANWGSIGNNVGGYTNVPWWNQLDYIGIDAYFPLSNVNNPSPAQLADNATAIADGIESWHSANHPNKQVLFTEIGYRSLDGASRAPGAIAWATAPSTSRSRPMRTTPCSAAFPRDPGGTARFGGVGRPIPTPAAIPTMASRPKTSQPRPCSSRTTAARPLLQSRPGRRHKPSFPGKQGSTVGRCPISIASRRRSLNRPPELPPAQRASRSPRPAAASTGTRESR